MSDRGQDVEIARRIIGEADGRIEAREAMLGKSQRPGGVGIDVGLEALVADEEQPDDQAAEEQRRKAPGQRGLPCGRADGPVDVHGSSFYLFTSAGGGEAERAAEKVAKLPVGVTLENGKMFRGRLGGGLPRA